MEAEEEEAEVEEASQGRQASRGGKPFLTADYVALDCQLCTGNVKGAAGGVQRVVLMASLASASPDLRTVSSHRVIDEGWFCELARCYSGVYRYRQQSSENPLAENSVGSQRTCDASCFRESETCTAILEEVSILRRTLYGMQSWCVKNMTNLIYRHLLLSLLISIDNEGQPYLSFHVKFKFWGTFQTPWRFLAQLGINCTPVKFLNMRDKQVLFCFV